MPGSSSNHSTPLTRARLQWLQEQSQGLLRPATMREVVDSSERAIRRKVSPSRAARVPATPSSQAPTEHAQASNTIAPVNQPSELPSFGARRPSVLASAFMAYDNVSNPSAGSALAPLAGMIDRADRGFDDDFTN